MRWDRLFHGFESLWDAENDNAELDERREILRADRAATAFVDVIAQRGTTGPLDVHTAESSGLVHCRRIGASWLDGIDCETGARVIVPFTAVVRVDTAIRCPCIASLPTMFAHVTLGAVLRELERNVTTVTVTIAHGGVHGTIRAVWRDAVEVGAGPNSALVVLAAIDRIVVNRA